jgi:selenide,water dikinase
MGGEPQTALAIATVPYGLEAKVEADLSAMMAGATRCCARPAARWSAATPAKAPSSRSALPSMGSFRRRRAAQGRLKPGDGLILTKPMGTGTLLAADMRGKAKARWVMAAIAHMIQSNAQGGGNPARHGVHAATDVTGFGLLGHLIEMVRASEVDATLAIERVPLLDGARRPWRSASSRRCSRRTCGCAAPSASSTRRRGIRSTRCCSIPQTSGGLLAAVPLAQAERCVAALRAGGYAGADLIGFVAARSAALEPVTVDPTGEQLAAALAGLHPPRRERSHCKGSRIPKNLLFDAAVPANVDRKPLVAPPSRSASPGRCAATA